MGGMAQARERVLFLGDSMSMGAFGAVMDREMRQQGFEVYTQVAGGASPYYWLSEYESLPCSIGYWAKTPERELRLGYVRAVPKIDQMLDLYQPDLVVVQTGVNLYATLRSKRRPKAENAAEIKLLIDRMCEVIAAHGARSFWVLPPHSHEERFARELQQELGQIMRQSIEAHQGNYFDSLAHTKFTGAYPATDGIHYGAEEASDWAMMTMKCLQSSVQPAGPLVARAVPVVEKPSAAAAVRSAEVFSLPAAGSASLGAGGNATAAPAKVIEGAPVEAVPEVLLKLRLVEKSEIPRLTDVSYANALGTYEYEVVKDVLGNYPAQRIRVANGVVFHRKLTHIARQEPGDDIELRLVPLANYPSLQQWQIFDDLRPNYEMPLYTPKLN